MGELVLQSDAAGLYCPAGGFHVDPCLGVQTAVITHAHADHAIYGSRVYYCAQQSVRLLKARLGERTDIRGVPCGERFVLGGARVSFHPAGHVLGSAQVRVEVGPRGSEEVWVASGDYKRTPDPTCAAFEVVPCDVFITEASFALPVYKWDEPAVIGREMLEWWEENAREHRASILIGYSIGKVQRAIAEIAKAAAAAGRPLGRLFMHGAIAPMVEAYRAEGIDLPAIDPMPEAARKKELIGSLTVAPQAVSGHAWMRRFGPDERYRTAFASGWMRVRGIRRRGVHDRGFALSDHCDWPGLLRTVKETGARRIFVTHGNIGSFVRYLREVGFDAAALETTYGQTGED